MLFHQAAFLQMDLFDSKMIAKAAEDHIAGRVNNGRLLWQLVMLEKSRCRTFRLTKHAGQLKTDYG